MSITKKHETKVKEIIASSHDGKLYQDNELPQIISAIVVEAKKECDIEDEKITTIVTQYLYFSSKDGKYYFNFKRRQTKKTEYHQKILNSVKDTTLHIDNISTFEPIKEPDLTISLKVETEPTSEELDKLENEIFKKIEKKVKAGANIKISNDTFLDVKGDILCIKPLNKKEVEIEYEMEVEKENNNEEYVYPVNNAFKYKKPKGEEYGPYGTQWVHDKQVDDILDEKAIKFGKQFDVLRAIVLPEQKSDEWFAMRNGKITASDGGTVLDVNSHEPQFKFIIKKTLFPPFESNVFVHHGTKYEDVSTMIYEYRMNVMTDEFGLIGHPKYNFLGASPDRICNKYKLDGKHKSKYIGRMLEIKCPYVRKIKMTGPIIDNICPIYYWVQTQLQLECCDLEECDFWQTEIKEYDSRYDFNADTDPDEPFRSKTTKFEKGCLIQLLPKKRMMETVEKDYNQVVYESSKYIYPPRVEMSPHDCDVWISEALTDMKYDTKYNDYYFDKVLYWKLVTSKNVLINRDRKWFADSLPQLKKMWDYVLFFRANEDKLQLFVDYIESRERKMNKEIMGIVEKLYRTSDPSYDKQIATILEEIGLGTAKKELKNEGFNTNPNNDSDEYMFLDNKQTDKKPTKTTTSSVQLKPTSQNSVVKKPAFSPFKKAFTKNNTNYSNMKNVDDGDDYMFV